MGMDWLSKRKFVIVCHEKVVRIPSEGDEILQVHGERTQGVVKTLMNTKVDEPKLSDISVIRDFINVFRKTCRRKVEFRIDLVHGATSVAKYPYRLAPLEMKELSEQLRELQEKVSVGITEEGEVVVKVTSGIHVDPMGDALSRKERVKSRRVRGMILAAQSEAFKQENILAERLHGLDPQMERKGDENNSKEWNSGDDQLRLRWMIYLVVLADAAESVRDAIGFEYCLASSSGWTKSPVLWAEIRESSLTGLELVQETTDKVVLVKEKPKAARDRQKSYVDYRRKPLEFEVGDRVLLKVTPWKGVVHIRCRKKGMLARGYVGHLEILERIGLIGLSADASLHVSLDEIKVDKTFRFVEEPVEIMDREVKRFLTSFLDDGRGSGSWMFLFVWSGYAAMRTLLWAGKVVSIGNQSIERDRLIGIGLVMDLVKFLSFTFGGKEMTFVVLAFLR
ncbi:hypothetical protein Tco_1105129 [Tanacetum coccineum]